MKTPYSNPALMALSGCLASSHAAGLPVAVERMSVANSLQPDVSPNRFHLTSKAVGPGFKLLLFPHVEIRREGGETVKIP